MRIGDKVSVIADTTSGRVSKIQGDKVYIIDEHGFELSFNVTEIVVQHGDYKLSTDLIEKEIEEKLQSLKKQEKPLKSFEIDLHIEELTVNHSYMTNHEILMKQMQACKNFVQQAIEKGEKRIVLIHGKGEGVLKAEIHLFLNKLKNLNGVNLVYHDASFSEYGMGGATEVEFF